MMRPRLWAAALSALLLASCGQVLLGAGQPSRQFGPTTSSISLNPALIATPTPGNQRFPGLTPSPLAKLTPVPTPNPIATPGSYIKEHAYVDLQNNGQQSLIVIAGDRRPSPPASPTPVLQYQKGEYAGNFIYQLEIWNWNPKTNQYTLGATWPNNPAKRYVDMRYHVADVTGSGTPQILVEARLEGVAQALDYALLRLVNGKLTPIFSQSGLEHGQVRIIGRGLWQEQAVRGPNEDACCPSLFTDTAFSWNGSQFVTTRKFVVPAATLVPLPTPRPLSKQATPVPLSVVSVPIPTH